MPSFIELEVQSGTHKIKLKSYIRPFSSSSLEISDSAKETPSNISTGTDFQMQQKPTNSELPSSSALDDSSSKVLAE
jgi:hypothetical protein